MKGVADISLTTPLLAQSGAHIVYTVYLCLDDPITDEYPINTA